MPSPSSARSPIICEATGSTAAVNSADLVARVAGFVQAIKYKDGDFVKKGKVLFVIEQEPYALKVEQAKASEVSARASLKRAQTDYGRQADLIKSGSTTQAKLDDAIANRDSAQAVLDQSVASLKQAEIDYGYTSVAAPFDGIVTARKVSVGAYVASTAADDVGDHRAVRPDLCELQHQRARRAAHPRRDPASAG